MVDYGTIWEGVAAITSSSGPVTRTDLLHNHDFLLLWGGQTISVLGSSVSGLVFPLLILSLTRSPAQAGIVGALGVLPYALLGLPAGGLVDRWSRKRVMIVCDVVRALVAAGIGVGAALGHMEIVWIYIAVLVSGTMFVFFNVAEMSALRHVVSRKQLPVAISRNQLSGSTVALIGPFLGGALYQLGRAIPFLADAVSYGASVLGLLLIRTDFQEERHIPNRKLRQDIVDGVRWLTRQPLLRLMWGLNAAMSFVGGGFTLLLILIARQQGASAPMIGTMFSLLGVGGIVGALIAPAVMRRFRFDHIIIGTGWMIVAVFLLLVIAPNPVILGLIAGANFILMPSCGAALQTYQVALIPDELQGRVNSVFMLVAFSASPVGRLGTALLFQMAGSTWTILALALVLACVALVETSSAGLRGAPPLASMSSP